MSSMPRLPPRKAGSPPELPAHEEMLSQASRLADNPALKKLIESPELLDAIKEQDPTLKRLLEQNPALNELLAPEKLRSVMQMVQNPTRLMTQGQSMFGGMGLPDQRQAVQQLESYSRDLQARMQQQQQPLDGAGDGELQSPLQVGEAPGGGGAPSLLQMRVRMQQLQQQLRSQQQQQAGAPPTAAAITAGPAAPRPWAAGMPPPHQSAAFFNPPSTLTAPALSGPVGGGDFGGGGGGFSFTHSEREVTLDQLPYDAQEKLLAAYGLKRDGASAAAPAAALAGAAHKAGSGSSAAAAAAGHSRPQVAAIGVATANGNNAVTSPSSLPSFSQWQQDQAAAAARAAQAMPPSAWSGFMTHGSVAAGQAVMHGSPPRPLPMSTPSREGGNGEAAAAGAAGAGATAPWATGGGGAPIGSLHRHGYGHGLGSHHHHHHLQQHPHPHPHPQNHSHSHGHGHGQSGAPCCAKGHDKQHHHHQQKRHQPMYGDQYDTHGGQLGLYGFGGGPPDKVRPRDYYEPVEPNLSWRGPQGQEPCGSLYRRAYHRYCDMLFFPPFFALAALLLTAAPRLPFWLLVGGLLAAAVPGAWCFVVVLAGLPRERMATSRNFLSLIATCEVVYPLVYGLRVLPYWTYGTTRVGVTLTLLACFLALPLLHLAAATADPGYVPRQQDQKLPPPPPPSPSAPLRGDAKAKQQQQQPAVQQYGRPNSDGAVVSATATAAKAPSDDVEAAVPAAAAMAAAAAPAAAAGMAGLGFGMLGLTAPMPEEDEEEGDGGNVRQGVLPGAAVAGSAAAAPVLSERQCGTCLVARPLRAKHCQFCNRCVRRFDHHCPAIANCVGEANERSFAAWLFTMVLTQVLVVYVTLSFLLQCHIRTTQLQPGPLLPPQPQPQRGVDDAAAAAAAVSAALAAAAGSSADGARLLEAPNTGPAAVWAALRWAASGPERGLVLLAGLQALCLLPAILLAARQALCILANLTANELVNRHRYNYLQDGKGDYCNRFDRGAAVNCFSFWLERNSDWRTQYDAGEREMCRRGVQRLTVWTVGWLFRWLDDYNGRRDALRHAVRDLRLEKARRGMAVRAVAAAAAQATETAAAAKKT